MFLLVDSMTMSTIFKWLFTIFAFWWLYLVLRPWLASGRSAASPPPPPDSKVDIQKKDLDKAGEYIDYEEIDED